jgi:hypothetical protein
MRDQYAGDISDLLKFAFLRALAGTDRTLGIAWYYALGDDGRPDGRHLEWRGEVAWQELDGDLHQTLGALPERSIEALERLAIWPQGTLFHREPMPHRSERNMWATKKRSTLYGADLIFLDPDNGLSDKDTKKHATFSELASLRQPGRALVFITFPGRVKHELLLKELHDRLKAEAHSELSITLRTSVSIKTISGHHVPRFRWFTVVDPDASLIERAALFTQRLSAIPGVRVQLDRLE